MATRNPYLKDIFLAILKCDQSNFSHSPLILNINILSNNSQLWVKKIMD